MGRSRLTLVAMSLGFAVVQLDVSVVNVAIRPIGTDLGAGLSQLQWIVNAYTIAFAAFILSAGALGDRIGAKRLFVGGFALFTLASAAAGLAPSVPVLIGARTVQGLGAAILVPSSLTLLNHAFEQPGHAIGVWAAGGAAALSGGPVVGGVLIETLGWRAIFFINVPIGLLGLWLTLRHATETPRAEHRGLDLPGQVSAVLALALLAAAIIQAPVLYVPAAVALGTFLAIEARARRPMLPLRLFRRRSFSLAAGIGLSLNTAVYGLMFVLSLYFQRAQGRSALETGLAFAPMTGIVMATNVYTGRLAERFSAPRVMLGGAVLGALACVALLLVDERTAYAAMVVPLVVLGGSVGLIVPLMTAELLAGVDRSQSGIASGTLNMLRQTGSVIGVALFGSLLVGGVVGGMHVALAISVALLAGVGGLALGL
jgi:DHA2 family methylenomycin A resistance protein-like MFS transporter